MNVLGKRGAGQGLPYWVVADVRTSGEAAEKAQRLKHTRINPQADSRIACFNPLNGRPRRERALSFSGNRTTARCPRLVARGSRHWRVPEAPLGRPWEQLTRSAQLCSKEAKGCQPRQEEITSSLGRDMG